MALPPNWFVSEFDSDAVMAEGLTDDQRIDAALNQIVNMRKVRNCVLDAIEDQKRRDRDRAAGGPLICGGASLPEAIRNGVSEILVEGIPS